MINTILLNDATVKVIRQMIADGVADALQKEKANNELVSSNELMQRYSMSRTTIWRLVQEGKLHPIKGKGRQNLYKAAECRKLFNN